MTSLNHGDIINGGSKGYYQVLDSVGTHRTMVQVLDDGGNPTQTYVMGVDVRTKTGDVFTVSTPDPLQANTPHDVCVLPNDAGILVAVVPSPGVLKFRLMSFDEPATLIHEWTPAAEAGWAQQPVKISVACNSRTVYYTSSLYKIKRYDIGANSGAGAQLTDYQTLPNNSPYRFGAIRVLPEEAADEQDAVIAMSLSGNGPIRGLCLASDGTSFWTDEINPPGQYHLIKWRLSDRTQLATAVTRADNIPTNDKTLSLASYYNPCLAARRSWGKVVS